MRSARPDTREHQPFLRRNSVVALVNAETRAP